MGVFRRTKVSFLPADPVAPLLLQCYTVTLRLWRQALQISQRPRSSSFSKTDDRRSLFRHEIQSSPIEINPRATELHTSPSLSWPKERSRPVQHFNYSPRSNLILYYNFQIGPRVVCRYFVQWGLIEWLIYQTNAQRSSNECYWFGQQGI